MAEDKGNGSSSARTLRLVLFAVVLFGVLLTVPWVGVGYCAFVGSSACPAFLSSHRARQPVAADAEQTTAARPPTVSRSSDDAVPPPPPSNAAIGANPKYVAIVIGNSDYAPPNALANPRNDATDMAAALEKLGYTLVRDDAKRTAAWLDVGYMRLDSALRAFGARAADAEVAVVYYAGHGMEEGGVNYLIPTDAILDRDVDLVNQGYAFENVTRRLPRYGISIVIIDACRTPRFKLADRKGTSRAVEGQRGFQVVEAPDRALFAFSAGPNQRASDGAAGERNSPYTKELVRAMQEPDVKIEDVFKSVRQKFIDRRADQKPEFRDNLGRPNLAFQPPEPAKKPGEEFQDCPQCPKMVVVPKGKFLMGAPASEDGSTDDEHPQREVTIAQDFAVGRFEVTFAEWDTCVQAGGCLGYKPDDHKWGRGDRPVINVSWYDAKQYVAWLNSLSTRGQGKYRLLTEAEWEYAARAKSTTAYPWGDRASHDYANYGSDSGLNGFVLGRDQWVNTSPAGSFPANRFGLFDMHGNVWEWVQDCWIYGDIGVLSIGACTAESDYLLRVVRGGSWEVSPSNLRSANRGGDLTTNRDASLGFRVARTL